MRKSISPELKLGQKRLTEISEVSADELQPFPISETKPKRIIETQEAIIETNEADYYTPTLQFMDDNSPLKKPRDYFGELMESKRSEDIKEQSGDIKELKGE